MLAPQTSLPLSITYPLPSRPHFTSGKPRHLCSETPRNSHPIGTWSNAVACVGKAQTTQVGPGTSDHQVVTRELNTLVPALLLYPSPSTTPLFLPPTTPLSPLTLPSHCSRERCMVASASGLEGSNPPNSCLIGAWSNAVACVGKAEEGGGAMQHLVLTGLKKIYSLSSPPHPPSLVATPLHRVDEVACARGVEGGSNEAASWGRLCGADEHSRLPLPTPPHALPPPHPPSPPHSPSSSRFPMGARAMRRRVLAGLKEVGQAVRSGRAKCVVLAPNVEEVPGAGEEMERVAGE
ncbi:unnamed protein product [Closterium sp. Naga37s-1]|nr:unnamed protein product [Closterium sp. Naga37s-1]